MTADIIDSWICSFTSVVIVVSVVVVVAVVVVAITVTNSCYFVSIALLCTVLQKPSECASGVIIFF